MKTRVLRKLFLLVISSISIFAQSNSGNKIYSEIVPNHTELRILHSDLVDDDFFLYIKLPGEYENSSKTYPVIYLLDGDIAFTMAWSTVRYLQYGKDLPDVIIVGIGYGSLLSSNEQNMRERDYTISKLERFEVSGGGQKFLDFLKTDLIPYVDSEFRTNPKSRILNGYSLGGLLTLNIYLTENNLFSGYIAGSPYISSDIEFLKETLKNNAEIIKNSNNKLFISYGELEEQSQYRNPIDQIVTKMYELNIMEIKKHVFENGSHFTCPSEAMVYGLKYIFE